MTQDFELLKKLYTDANQNALFHHIKNLDSTQRNELFKNLQSVADREPPAKLIEDCQNAIKLQHSNLDNTDSHIIGALPQSSFESIIGKPDLEKEYYDIGKNAISNNEVAVILMAGGQGTRLGSSLPKGCFDVNLPSHKSLFQIQAERLLVLQNICHSEQKVVIPWYIMTSGPTRNATEKFFVEHDYFGLNKDQIIFFNQGTLPAFDLKGERFLLNSPTELVQSPDGNGGLYRALKDNKIIDNMFERGVKHVYMYCVDNILSKLADPVFLGFAIKHNFQLATKAVRKRDAHEPVGLIATKNNRPCVIEYSEISKELAESKDENGLLKYRAGNIVNHYYHIDLLKDALDDWCGNIPFHIAKKKIPFYDNIEDTYVKPDEPNGIKLEQFIFDVFPTIPLTNFGCLEVERSKEFSPLKNSIQAKVDNPITSRSDYLKLSTSWLKNAGALVNDDVLIEVSTKLSYSGENLEQFKGKVFDKNEFYLQ